MTKHRAPRQPKRKSRRNPKPARKRLTAKQKKALMLAAILIPGIPPF